MSIPSVFHLIVVRAVKAVALAMSVGRCVKYGRSKGVPLDRPRDTGFRFVRRTFVPCQIRAKDPALTDRRKLGLPPHRVRQAFRPGLWLWSRG